jgi:group I intron endonuclease
MKLIDNGFDDKQSGIYKITNRTTGQVYIGSSKELRKRYQQHRLLLKNDAHPNNRLQASYNKYGVESFSFEIVESVLDLSRLIGMEQVYLDWYYATQDPLNLSRLAGKVEFSAETRKKISDTRKSRDYPKHRAAMEKYHEERPDLTLALNQAGAKASVKKMVFDEASLKQLIRDYLAMETPSILVLANKYAVDFSTIAKIFKRTVKYNKFGNYTEILTKIGFEGSSIKDLQKPEIQAKLILD